jgi:predicted PurR-regulated permease PerM
MSAAGDSDREFIARSVRWGITLAVAGMLLLAALFLLKAALTPLIAAFALAYLLDPLIDRFEARKVGRPVAIFVLVGLSMALALASAFFLLPRISHEIAELGHRLPGYLEATLAWVGPRLKSWGIDVPASIDASLEALRSGGLSVPLETLRKVLEGALLSITGTLGALVGMLVIPVIAYYALVEFDGIKAWFLELVPIPYRERVVARASTINALIAGFIRGQLIVCGLLAVLYAIGFSLIGIDLAVGIGLLAGLLAIIPYVGGAVALSVASALCLLRYGIDIHIVLVVGWYTLVQTAEGLFLTPRIVGRSVGIHPVAVIVGLLIGGDLLGFLGLLVAVPLTAVIQVFVRELLEAYWGSSLYTGEAELGS